MIPDMRLKVDGEAQDDTAISLLPWTLKAPTTQPTHSQPQLSSVVITNNNLGPQERH